MHYSPPKKKQKNRNITREDPDADLLLPSRMGSRHPVCASSAPEAGFYFYADVHDSGDVMRRRYLVIENELGVEGVDHDLLVEDVGREQIILLSNGCKCMAPHVAAWDHVCAFSFELALLFNTPGYIG